MATAYDRVMTSSGVVRRPDSGYVDALTGNDGTADTPSLLWTTERFSDALAAPEADPVPLGAAVRYEGVPSSVRPSKAPPARRAAAPRSAAAHAQGSAVSTSATASASAYSASSRPRQAVVPVQVARSAVADDYRVAAPGQYPGGGYAALQDSTPQYSVTRYRKPQYAANYGGTQQPGAAPAAPLARNATARQANAARYLGTKPTKKKSGVSGFFAFLIVVIIVLIATGIGRQIIDGITTLIHQWTR